MTAALLSFAVAFVASALILVGDVWFLARLRARHRACWREVASPLVLTNIPSRRYNSFLFGRRFRQLADPALTAVGHSLLVVRLLSAVSLVVFFASLYRMAEAGAL